LDEIAAGVECSIANSCSPLEGGFVGQGPCLDERNALATCKVSHYVDGTVSGTTTTCNWERRPWGATCNLSCLENPARAYSAECEGPPDGPLSCVCQLNHRALGDSLVSNGSRFYVDTCQAAGQMLADGFCHQFINCCYTFRGVMVQGLPEQTLCECTSKAPDATSCEALAASHPDGKVVDICPGYEPVWVVPTP
jgi:hypothetical protein